MPVFEITLTKQRTDNELWKWNNVYHVLEEDAGAALSAIDTIVDFETAIHTTAVTIVNARLREMSDPTVATNRPLSQVGSYVITGDGMPLFLAVRADFVPAFGRSGRKFYHAALGESDQAGGQLSNGYETAFENAKTTLLASMLGSFCADDGSPVYLDIVLKPTLTQHQFKRKWARRGGV